MISAPAPIPPTWVYTGPTRACPVNTEAEGWHLVRLYGGRVWRREDDGSYAEVPMPATTWGVTRSAKPREDDVTVCRSRRGEESLRRETGSLVAVWRRADPRWVLAADAEDAS